jgi:hypothetical protein
VLAGCGGGDGRRATLGDACSRGNAGIAEIRPIVTLADSAPAVERALAVERAALSDVRGATEADDPLVRRLEQAATNARLFLAAARRADAQGSMSPLRTSAPDARRIVGLARDLVGQVCRRAKGAG